MTHTLHSLLEDITACWWLLWLSREVIPTGIAWELLKLSSKHLLRRLALRPGTIPGMGEKRPSGDGPTTNHTQRLTIPETARELGVTSEAVRGRVKRGTLESERSADGTVYVLLDEVTRGQPTTDQTATDQQPTADPPRDQSELVEELRARVQSLEHQLAEANTRDRENRRLLAAALERMPELESQEQGESAPRSTEEPQARGTAPPGEHRATQRRSWLGSLRRLFDR